MSLKDFGIINDMPRGWVTDKSNPWHLKAYNMWRNMWNRAKTQYYCEVDNRFIYLSNFIEWLESEPNFQDFIECNKTYNIDKDIKDCDNRNYYPINMSLVLCSTNVIERNNRRGNPSPSKPIIALSKDKIFLFKALLDVRKYHIGRKGVYRCLTKEADTFRGYKWFYINHSYHSQLRLKDGEYFERIR